MASSDMHAATPAPPAGPVLFAYDGSELAKLAIDEAGRQLAPGRDALVVCVWQTGDVGFLPADEQHLNAAEATEVRKAAEEVAAHGASLAEKAGFRSQSIAITAAPTWKGIVDVANERNASLIVLGSHRRRGLQRHLLGSVAAAVVAHSGASVLVAHGVE
jgi:nucleotide-binding universal stress UspA family protein